MRSGPGNGQDNVENKVKMKKSKSAKVTSDSNVPSYMRPTKSSMASKNKKEEAEKKYIYIYIFYLKLK